MAAAGRLGWRQFAVGIIGTVALLCAACASSTPTSTQHVTYSNTNIGTPYTAQCPATAACAVGTSAASYHSGTHPVATGNLTIGDLQSPDSVNPMFADQRIDFNLIRAIYGSCVVAGADLKWRPDECTQVPTQQNHGVSADGTTITMKLLPDLKWSDGQPLTAADFVFAWTVLRDPQTNAFNIGGYSAIAAVTATDAHTITVQLNAPLGPYLTYLPYALPQHEFAGISHAQWLANSEINFQPKVTSGPYQITGYQLSDHWRLQPNPNYTSSSFFGPFAQSITFKTYPDAASLAAAVGAGHVTLAQGFAPADLPTLRAAGVTPTLINAIGYEQVAYNQANATLARRAVRQALALAVDKCALEQQALGEPCATAVATTITSPTALDFDQTITTPFDRTQANALLDQAGFNHKNNTGQRLGADGKPLTFTLVTPNDATRATEATILAAAWQAIGITVKIAPYASSVLYADFTRHGLLATGQWDIAIYAFVGSADPDFTFDSFHSSAIPSQTNPGGTNYAHISDPQLDRVLQTERETIDFDARVTALHQAQEMIVAQQFAVTPLYIWPVITATSPQVRGFVPGPALNQTDWNSADWWLAT